MIVQSRALGESWCTGIFPGVCEISRRKKAFRVPSEEGLLLLYGLLAEKQLCGFCSALCTKRIWAVRNIMNREEVKSTVKEVSHKQTAYYCCEYVIRVFEYPQ